MYLCTALRVLGVPILPTAPGTTPQPVNIGVSWVFAVLAWSNGRGHNWARILFAVWVGLHTLALLADAAVGSALSAPAATLIVTGVSWLVELSAAVLVMSRPSSVHHRHKPA
jgi:hypothetical protein